MMMFNLSLMGYYRSYRLLLFVVVSIPLDSLLIIDFITASSLP